jgi:hypothetical protein
VAISFPILKTGSKFKSKNKISIQVAKKRKFIWGRVTEIGVLCNNELLFLIVVTELKYIKLYYELIISSHLGKFSESKI